MWEEIETRKAKERQAINGSKNLGLNMDNVPSLENNKIKNDKGAVRDIIAEKVGIGSGRTYERAKNAVNKIKTIIL